MRQEIIDDPDLAIPWYLMSVWLYADQSSPVLHDSEFDELCELLDNAWSSLSHPHKHLIRRSSLADNTSCGYDLTSWPYRLKAGALRWLESHNAHKDLDMLKIGDTFEIDYNSAGWTLRHFQDGTPTERNPTPGRSCRTMYFASLHQAAMKAADLDCCAFEVVNEIAAQMEATRFAIVEAIAIAASGGDEQSIVSQANKPKAAFKPKPIIDAKEVSFGIVFRMTDKAVTTRDAYHKAGWTDDQLIEHELMEKLS